MTRLIFDCGYPRISSNLFIEYDWFGLYKDIKDYIPTNIPEGRGHKFSIYMFVYANLVEYKSNRHRQMGVLILSMRLPLTVIEKIRKLLKQVLWEQSSVP